jgi:hypothetical protein
MIRSVLAFAFVLGCSALQADPVFDFSWTSIGPPEFDYSTAGVTITGQIFGLPDNGTGPATDIVVDSITGVTPDPVTIFSNLPVDLMSAGCQVTNFPSDNDDQFVVQNDVITSASFFCQENLAYTGTFGLGTGTPWAEYISGGLIYPAPPDFVVFEPGSIPGYMGTATYSLAPVPEPSHVPVIVLAMFLAIAIGRRSIENRRRA